MNNNKVCKFFKGTYYEELCTLNNNIDDEGGCVYGNGIECGNPICKFFEEQEEKKNIKPETRFFKRAAFLTNFDCFEKVMQELLDDSSLKIEKEYPVLSMYSEGSHHVYDEDEITDIIGNYLGINIIGYFMYVDLEEICFVSDK